MSLQSLPMVPSLSRAARSARPWVAPLARLGYASKGILYVVVGVLAGKAAAGAGGRATDTKGALRNLHDQPFGQVLLLVLALGLAGYAVWRLVQAATNPEGEAKGRTAPLKRAGWLGSGLLHVGLVIYAMGLLTGTAEREGGGWTRTVMSWDGVGVALVAIAGLVSLGLAAHMAKSAWTSKLDEQLALDGLSSTTRRAVVAVSRAGMAARAIVFAIVGYFFLLAALHSDPRREKGLGDALSWLQQQAYGAFVLGAVAVGVACYGLYNLVRARYRRIEA